MRRSPRRSPRHWLAVASASFAATLLAVLSTPAPASAHVTVSAAAATQGGYAKLTFRVPNEKTSAATTKLEVNLPVDAPLASVSVKPVPGWTVQPDKTKLPTPIKDHDGELTEAVTKITWIATGDAGIKPGQFQEFEISVGPLPERDQLIFKALQTYADNDVVRWIDEPAAGAEPEHPAPVLKLAKKADPNADSLGTNASPAAVPASTSASGGGTGDDSTLPITLSVVGLLAGLAGLAAGLLAYRKASATRA